MLPTREKIWKWCKNSEVILWGYIQVILGAISACTLALWYVLSTTDLSPIIKDPRWLTAWAIINGLITIWLRQRGTITKDGHLVDKDTVDKDDDTMNPGDVKGN